MAPKDIDNVSMVVWCTLLPPEELDQFSEADDLRSVIAGY